jgi:hypothetical protein
MAPRKGTRPAVDAVDPIPGAETIDAGPVTVIPEPTAIKKAIYPCIVQVPGQPPRDRAKAYITPEGIYVYWAVPDPVGTWAPDYYAPITWPQPQLPPPHMWRNGFRVQTDLGPVAITGSGGCGCGWPLKRWTPSWAQRVVSWDE